MSNTPNYGLPYPAGADAIEGTFIQRLADAANTVVNTSGKLTTKGDLLIRQSGTPAITRLAVGSSGSYLLTAGTADTNRVAWSGSFSGTHDNALELIATGTVGTAGASSISFTSIPSTYSMLILKGNYQASDAGVERLRIRFNNNSGSVYKSAYTRYNNAVQTISVDAGTFASGTANHWYAGQINGWQEGLANETNGAVSQRGPNEWCSIEAYFPEYASTAGTNKGGYATTTRSNFGMRPDYRGKVGTVCYVHFSEDIFSSHTYAGHGMVISTIGIDALLDSGTVAPYLWTTVDLVAGGENSSREDDWTGGDVTITSTLARHGTNGTVTIDMKTTKRPGLRTGDTFIISGYNGTALGINGTWAAASVTTSGTSIVTYNSGVAGTIAATNFNNSAQLRMTRSGYFKNAGTVSLADGTAASTAYVQVGGTEPSILGISSVRYLEGNTAISTILITANIKNSIFQLYGVK